MQEYGGVEVVALCDHTECFFELWYEVRWVGVVLEIFCNNKKSERHDHSACEIDFPKIMVSEHEPRQKRCDGDCNIEDGHENAANTSRLAIVRKGLHKTIKIQKDDIDECLMKNKERNDDGRVGECRKGDERHHLKPHRSECCAVISEST